MSGFDAKRQLMTLRIDVAGHVFDFMYNIGNDGVSRLAAQLQEERSE